MLAPSGSQRGSGQQPLAVSLRARGALGSGVDVGGTGVVVAVGPGVAVTRMGGCVGARLPRPGWVRGGGGAVGPPGAPLSAKVGGANVGLPPAMIVGVITTSVGGMTSRVGTG